MVDTFFCAPTNWKNVTNAQGKTLKYPNHWHFSSTTVPCKTARFLTVMDTHGKNRPDMQVVRKGNTIQVGDWTITCNLTEKGKAAIYVSNKTEKVSLNYDAGKKEGATIVTDQVKVRIPASLRRNCLSTPIIAPSTKLIANRTAAVEAVI